MKRAVYFTSLMLLICSAGAEEMILRSGRVLKDAKVVSVEDESVHIQYADGVANVSYLDLTEAQQQQLNMTPDQVAARRQERKERAAQARQNAEERARRLRESLSESEKQPRYLRAEDVSSMFLMMGELSPVEREVMALQWNAREADRVGLSEDARVFRERLKEYKDQLALVKQQRQEAEAYWKDLENKYNTLQSESSKTISSLKNQIARLKNEVEVAENQPKTERIIVTPGYYQNWGPWIYSNPPPPPAPAIVRPVPVVPARPVGRPNPVTPSSSPFRTTIPGGVRPAGVTPAKPIIPR